MGLNNTLLKVFMRIGDLKRRFDDVFGPKIAIFGLKTGFYCNVSKSTFSEPLDYYSCIHKCVLNPYKKFFDGGHEKKEVGKDKRGRNLQNFNFWRFLREIF